MHAPRGFRCSMLVVVLAALLFPLSALAQTGTSSSAELQKLSFKGHYRKTAKTSIARGQDGTILPFEQFPGLDSLKSFLPDDKEMRGKHPDLATKPNDVARKDEEQHNVELDAWLYAAKFEDGTGTQKGDNDVHLIIGSSDDALKAVFFNTEVSGLPTGGNDKVALSAARDQFLNLFPDMKFPASFTKLPRKKVHIQGSVYFDADHQAGCAQCPGPSFAKPQSVWEIHPITSITLVSDGETKNTSKDKGGATSNSTKTPTTPKHKKHKKHS